MDNHQFNKAIEGIRKIRPTEEEKSLMLARIMDYAGIKAMPAVPSPYVKSWTTVMSQVNFARDRMKQVVMALILAMVVLGGTVFAAEGALPGDFLYPVKVKVVEPMGDILALDLVTKMKWEAEKVGRRLIEAEQLSDEGKLDSLTKEEIKNNIAAHVAELESLENALKQYGPTTPADVKAELVLQAQIEAHSTIFQDVWSDSFTNDSGSTTFKDLQKILQGR
jgi:hypothetical protein